MTDLAVLTAAVLAAPDDDTPRLAYADWCDDHGQPARAEFVRVQVELARSACPDSCSGSAGCVCGLDRPRRRERELFAAYAREWFGDRAFLAFLLPRVQAYLLGAEGVDQNPWWIVSRGFPSELRCTLAAFVGGECPACRGLRGNWDELEPGIDPATSCVTCRGEGALPGLAAAAAGRWPLTGVGLVDREPEAPTPRGSVWRWSPEADFPGEMYSLPEQLWERLPGAPTYHLVTHTHDYPTRADALTALSAACVAHSRSLCGLG